MDPRYPIGDFAMPASVTPAAATGSNPETLPKHPQSFRAGGEGIEANRSSILPNRDGGMDRPPGGASPAGQPHERLRALQAGAHRIGSHHINRNAEDKWAELGRFGVSTPDRELARIARYRSIRDGDLCFCARFKPGRFFAKAGSLRTAGEKTIGLLLFVYGWHGPHHSAHITELRKAKSW